jgi:hypothetical protein
MRQEEFNQVDTKCMCKCNDSSEARGRVLFHLTACPFAVPHGGRLIMHALYVMHAKKSTRQGGKWPAWREQLPSWGTHTTLPYLPCSCTTLELGASQLQAPSPRAQGETKNRRVHELARPDRSDHVLLARNLVFW